MVTPKTWAYVWALIFSALLAAISGVAYGGFGFAAMVFVIAGVGTCLGVWVLIRLG
jgi:hypothetical protein